MDKDYLYARLKDGTTYQEYLDESKAYRNHIIDGFAQEVLFSPMDEDELLQFAKSTVTDLLPDLELFEHEEDYNEVFNETLTELVPFKVEVIDFE